MDTTSIGIPIPDADPENRAPQLLAMALAINGLFIGLRRVAMTANVVRSNTTMTALAELSRSVLNGRRYDFDVILRVADSAAVAGAGEGIKVDLNGGTATVTDFWATFEIKDWGFSTIKHGTALADVASIDAVGGGDGLVQINGSFTATADGTFIPRVAQTSHTSGSITVLEGSSISLQEAA